MTSLPKGKATILRFDVSSGDQMRVPPLLSLSGAGGVRVRMSADSDQTRDAQLSDQALAALLRQIVKTERLGEIDADALPMVQPAGGVVQLGSGGALTAPVVADAPTTFILLDLPGCRQEIAYYGLRIGASAFSDNADLQSLHRVEQVLLALLAKVQSN